MDSIKRVLKEDLIEELSDAVFENKNFDWRNIEEIRMRVNRQVYIKCHDKEYTLMLNGQPFIMDKAMIKREVTVISKSSFYAFEDEISQGYITVKGGHRIGLCGEAVLRNGTVKTLKNINGINFRIAREIFGAGNCLLPYITDKNTVRHTLIAAPPAVGKTTVLRDLARIFGNGEGVNSVNVGIADERSELSGCFSGVPQLHIGEKTDVICGCSKAEGMMLLIRSMAPQLIITDEIGKKADAEAMLEAMNCGVKVIASVHGDDWKGLKKRPFVNDLLKDGFFERIIILGRKNASLYAKAVYDSEGNRLC